MPSMMETDASRFKKSIPVKSTGNRSMASSLRTSQNHEANKKALEDIKKNYFAVKQEEQLKMAKKYTLDDEITVQMPYH